MAAASPTWTTSWTGAFCKLFRIQQHPENSHLHPSNRLFLNGVEKLLWKSLVGAALVLAPTVANLAVLYHMKGREQGWLCLTVCTLDGGFHRSFFSSLLFSSLAGSCCCSLLLLADTC